MNCTNEELVLCPLLSIIGFKERELDEVKVKSTSNTGGKRQTPMNNPPNMLRVSFAMR